MAKQIKLRRGTTAEHSNFTGAEAEVTVDTDKNTVVVHDGATEGGYALLKGSDVRVATLADLQALDTSNARSVQMLGRSTAGDGAAGTFVWDSSDLSTEVGNDEMTTGEGDGGVYVAPTSDKSGSSGAWVRVVTDDRYSPLMYGAVADGSADDRDAIAKTVERAISENKSVMFPNSSFYIGGPEIEFASGITLIFDNTEFVVDENTVFNNNGGGGGVFQAAGASTSDFLTGFYLLGHVNLTRVDSGVAVLPKLVRMNFVEDFYIESVTVKGPGRTNESEAAIWLKDCKNGLINRAAGFDFGTTAQVVIMFRCRNVSCGWLYGEGGSEVVDLSMCAEVDTGIVTGKDLDNEVVDAGNCQRCRFPYTVGTNCPTIINLKMESPAGSGVTTSKQCADNEIGYVYGTEFTDFGITWGTSASGGVGDESFLRNTIKNATLISTQPGSKGIRPSGGNASDSSPAEGNVIEYAYIVTEDQALVISGSQTMPGLKLLSGHYETTGDDNGIQGNAFRITLDNGVPGLFVGRDVKFKGNTSAANRSVDFNKTHPLTFLGEIDGSGGEGLYLDYRGEDADLEVEISARISNTTSRGIYIQFDAGGATQNVDVNVHDCVIRNHVADGIRFSNGGGVVEGIFADNNKIFGSGDGSNYGIAWPGSVFIDYSADRHNDIYDVGTIRTNSPGTNGQLINGVEK